MEKLEADIELFRRYMQLVGVPELVESRTGPYAGKSVGLINGSSWIALWSTYFGRRILPGARLVNVGNEAVQLNFMAAHQCGEPCPPQVNIDLFVQYAKDLVRLWAVDAILITCSTMNRAAGAVRDAMIPHGVPVLQIDEAMMEAAVRGGSRILVVATHGPTVESTQALLHETAARLGKQVSFCGATVEEAFELLGGGRIEEHNACIADAIRRTRARESFDIVVLAQLSMSIFKLSYPDCEREIGFPVLTSGETGFARLGKMLLRDTTAIA